MQKHPNFAPCFTTMWTTDPRVVLIDGSYKLCTYYPHTPDRLRKADPDAGGTPYTCRDFVNDFCTDLRRHYYDYGSSVHTVVLVIDIPEFVPKAKACEQQRRRAAKSKTTEDLELYAREERKTDVPGLFGDAHYDRNATCLDEQERASRIQQCMERMKAAPPEQRQALLQRKRMLCEKPTLEQMLQLDKPLPGPFSSLLSDKKRGQRAFIRWLVKQLTQNPETALPLSPTQEFIVVGHCLRKEDFEGGSDDEFDDSESEEDMAEEEGDAQDSDELDEDVSVFTMPIVATRPKKNEPLCVQFCSDEYRNFIGEGDYSIYFVINTMWRLDCVKNNCFVIVGTDTDFITAGLMFLAHNVYEAPSASITIYHMFSCKRVGGEDGKEKRVREFCDLVQLFTEVEDFVQSLQGIQAHHTPEERTSGLASRSTHHMIPTPYASQTLEQSIAKVDALSARYRQSEPGGDRTAAFLSPVCQFVAMLALYGSDYSKKWREIGAARIFQAFELFPNRFLPLVERDPDGVIRYNAINAFSLLVCAYTVRNAGSFKTAGGPKLHRVFSHTRLAHINSMSAPQLCNYMWDVRRTTKDHKHISLQRGDPETFVKMHKPLPPDTLEFAIRLSQCQYFLHLLQQTGYAVVRIPDELQHGYVCDAEGHMSFLHQMSI
jgi:hypothetical protein